MTLKGSFGKPGPFQIVQCESSAAELPGEPPRRRYDCEHYETCLDLAAALNWDNFTCRGCCGKIDEALYWRAHQIARKDKVVQKLCGDLPEIRMVSRDDDEIPPTAKVAGER